MFDCNQFNGLSALLLNGDIFWNVLIPMFDSECVDRRENTKISNTTHRQCRLNMPKLSSNVHRIVMRSVFYTSL